MKISNRSSKKVQCPFDAFHIIDEDYYENHIINCSSSRDVKGDQYSFDPTKQLGTVSLEMVKQLSVPLMKDWHEEHVETYDPWANLESRDIIQCLIGGTETEEQKFKLAERQRLKELEKRDIINTNLSRNLKSKKSSKSKNVSRLAQNVRKLSLVDFDTLLDTIDFSKLFINDNDVPTEMVKITGTLKKLAIEKVK